MTLITSIPLSNTDTCSLEKYTKLQPFLRFTLHNTTGYYRLVYREYDGNVIARIFNTFSG